MKKRNFLFVLFIAFINICNAQLILTTGLSPQQLANIIAGPGINVSNVSFTGDTTMIASFTAMSTNLGISSGIMLATGNVNTARGPNNSSGAGTDMGVDGDSTLSILAGAATYDACILEFDFIPQSDSFNLHYVFGSEEYPEYVCSLFNDIFAFYISGPGISGNQNIALIPGVTTPVGINTINGGSIGSNGTMGPHCILSNPNFYVDNTGGSTIQLDGFTTLLEAKVTVIALETYHLRIMIADVGDGSFDSDLFIEEGSLTSGVGNVNNENYLSVFPNPVSDRLYITGNLSNKKNHFRLYDIGGKLIMNVNIGDDNQSIDVANLGKGIYFAEFISGNNEILHNRFVKE